MEHDKFFNSLYNFHRVGFNCHHLARCFPPDQLRLLANNREITRSKCTRAACLVIIAYNVLIDRTFPALIENQQLLMLTAIMWAYK